MWMIAALLHACILFGPEQPQGAQDAQTGVTSQAEPPRKHDLPKAPPDGAVVLFDGTDTAAFRDKDGQPVKWPVREGVLEVDQSAGDIFSRETFGDCLLHVEWNSPPGAAASNQLEGNSGVKLQGEYEIQILNSPGAPHKLAKNEAGAIYNLRPATPNASTGPGTWQTFDIWFTAPRWDGETKTANARITMYWNGVLVHEDIEVPDKTGASRGESPGDHSMLFQAHASTAEGDVKFRNVWVVRDPMAKGFAPPR